VRHARGRRIGRRMGRRHHTCEPTPPWRGRNRCATPDRVTTRVVFRRFSNSSGPAWKHVGTASSPFPSTSTSECHPGQQSVRQIRRQRVGCIPPRQEFGRQCFPSSSRNDSR
jgi:hypothetical protein